MTATQARNGSVTEARLTAMQEQLNLMAWLHAELAAKCERMAAAVAAMLSQQMQPQMQQAILSRLMGG